MGLQELWFFLIAALFLGFLILEGFDFGVGMLMIPFGAASKNIEGGGHDTAERHRRAALNTIGPVWDGNEVWLITAGAAMFAAFPVWYATVFSALYLPLLAILFGMIVRIVGIEWRGKIDDPKWRDWADIGIALGSWLPAILWGWRSRSWCRVCPSTPTALPRRRCTTSSIPTRCWVGWPPPRCSRSTGRPSWH